MGVACSRSSPGHADAASPAASPRELSKGVQVIEAGKPLGRSSSKSSSVGQAAAMAMATGSILASCLGLLGFLNTAKQVYSSAYVAVEAALDMAHNVYQQLQVIQSFLTDVEKITAAAGPEEGSSIHHVLCFVHGAMMECEVALRDFHNAYNPGDGGRRWNLTDAVKLRFASCEQLHLPRLKAQLTQLQTAGQNLQMLLTLQLVSQVDGRSSTSVGPQVLFRRENLPVDVPNFFDPYELQQDIRRVLDDKGGSSNNYYSLAASGQGGVGKSVMAAKFCLDAVQDSSRYRLVFWLHAETREACIQSLRDLVSWLYRLCKHGQLPVAMALPSELEDILTGAKRGSATHDWCKRLTELLDRTSESWLLVYDNYSAEVPVYDLIPHTMTSATQRHHVLLTTRDPYAKQRLEVKPWKAKHSEYFLRNIVFAKFKKRYPGKLVPETEQRCLQQLPGVCAQVAGLPLALALIADNLCSEWQLGNTEYDLQLILDKWSELAATEQVNMADGRVKQDQTLNGILLVSLERLTRDPANQQLALAVDSAMSMIAYVAARDIPVSVLNCKPSALEWMERRSLLTRAPGTGQYHVHRLTQHAMRHRDVMQCKQHNSIRQVLVLLGDGMDSSGSGSASSASATSHRLRTHAAAALSWAPGAGVQIPRSVRHELKSFSVQSAVQSSNIELLREINLANPAAMMQLDVLQRNAFHHAFHYRNIKVMYWLVTCVLPYQTATVILPSPIGCDLRSLALKKARLTSAELTRLAVALAKVPSLVELSVQENELTSFPQELARLTSLRKLSAFANNLGTDEDHAVGAAVATSGDISAVVSLTNLTHLALDINHITALPDGLCGLTQLKELRLSGNMLSCGGIAPVRDMPMLARLWLDNNKLSKTLPDGISSLTGLQELHLAHNALRQLGVGIGALINLRLLDVAGNMLKSLPAEMAALSRLETLSAPGNALVSLPSSLGTLTKLRVLRLDNNKIKASGIAVLAKLTGLTSLLLDNNKLKYVPAQMAALTSLTYLSLERNPFSKRTQSFAALDSIPNLTTLTLSRSYHEYLSSPLEAIVHGSV